MKKILSLLLVLTLLVGLYTVPTNAATVQPVIYLNFDGDLKDSSGNNYHGESPDAVVEFTTDSVLGKAAKIDNAMITLKGSHAINFDKEFSLSVWIKLSTDQSSGSIISAQSVEKETTSMLAVYNGYADTYIGTYGLFETVDDEGTVYDEEQTFWSSNYIEPDQNKEKFMHVAVIYNGSTLKYYIDGKLDSSKKINEEGGNINGIFYGTMNDIIVGGIDSSSFFHGSMDELRIYNKAIALADVTELYQAGIKTASNKIVLTIDDPYMFVNGVKKEIDEGKGTCPTVTPQNRTILPIRAIIESMGGTIGWDKATKMVTVNYKNTTIKLWIDNEYAEVNGVKKEIEEGKHVVPQMINNRTMLPIRFILKELGLPDLAWNSTLRTITIFY